MILLLNPQLLEGAWNANAPRLTELTADYKLIADIATAYGRIEELRWRLRVRTEQKEIGSDDLTSQLVEELRPEVADLLQRITHQLENPDVQPVGLTHVTSGTVIGRGIPSGAEAPGEDSRRS
jgi:hypothetical protein